MITCSFENGHAVKLRHVVAHALVEKDGAILLVKRAPTLFSEPGKWSLPGGFLDYGETIVTCAIRELKEETGWEGEAVGISWINSRPDRPGDDRQNVSFDVVIRPTIQTGSPDHETSEIAWVPFDQLATYEPIAFDHGESVKKYLEYRKDPRVFPVFD